MVSKDKESIEEIRKICDQYNVPLEEISSALTASSIKKQTRIQNIKEYNSQGKEYFFIEQNCRNSSQASTFLKKYLETKYIKSDYISELKVIYLCNKNKLYFILERIHESEFLSGDFSLDYLPKIEDRIKLCLNIVNCVINLRKELLEKIKDQQLVTLYGLSTEKFLYSQVSKRVQFTNIGIDELIVSESDTNDKRFWSPQKFVTLFNKLNKYKQDIYALGCIIYEIISGHTPLVENSEAAFEEIKNKKNPLISSSCMDYIEDELKDFQKKEELISLINRMTELEEENRNITFEEVYKILFSFLPEYINKIRCKNCLEEAEVILKSNQEMYCKICFDNFASKNDSNFCSDNLEYIQETINDTIYGMRRKQDKNLQNINELNQYNNHIDQINAYEAELNEFNNDIDKINQQIDETIDLLRSQKALLNEHYTNYFKSNKLFCQRSLSIYTELKTIIDSSYQSKLKEFEEIEENKNKYQKDFHLLLQDITRLKKSSEETKILEQVCQTYSGSFEKKFDDHLSKNKSNFKSNLDQGFVMIQDIQDKINGLTNVTQSEDHGKLNELNSTQKVIEERLKNNSNEDECLKISKESEFSEFIYLNDLGDDEGDTEYYKNADN